MKKYAEQMNWYINQFNKDVQRLNDLHQARIKNIDNYTMEDLQLDYDIKLFQFKLKELELLTLKYKVAHAKFLINIKKDEMGVNNDD